MNLKYIKIAEAVTLDKTDQEICCAIWEVKDLREKLLELIERKVKEEVWKICGRNFSSCFRASMASDLKSFSYEEQEKEFVEQCPILNRVITAASVNERNLKRNKIKCTDQVRNAKLTGIGIILNARNREMNMHQMMTSIILKRGGANKKTFRRLAARGLCISYQSTLRIQTRMAQNHDIQILRRKRKVEANVISNNENMDMHNTERSNEPSNTNAETNATLTKNYTTPGISPPILNTVLCSSLNPPENSNIPADCSASVNHNTESGCHLVETACLSNN